MATVFVVTKSVFVLIFVAAIFSAVNSVINSKEIFVFETAVFPASNNIL